MASGALARAALLITARFRKFDILTEKRGRSPAQEL